VPWHALRGRLLSISLADVYLCAAPRPESDWEEGPAGDRARAAKRARLKAVEMERLSKPAGSGERAQGLGRGSTLHAMTIKGQRVAPAVCRRTVHMLYALYAHYREA